ncbi:MAG: hypothetical protein ACRD2B_15560 [Terriglobia bacterium]
MKIILLTGFLMAVWTVPIFSAPKKTTEPTVAGTTEGNTGCVILSKGMPAKRKLFLAGVIYVRTQYKVLETVNAKLPKQKYTGPGDVKKLNEYAVKNKIKLVVIPSKHTEAQFDQAKKLCATSSSEK